MASSADRLPTNVAGDFFVDSSCIDCEACRWIAPKTFDYLGGTSRVFRQPETDFEKHRALMALIACPTASIGTVEKHDMTPVTRAFPDPIDGGVYHAGYHAESSFGAASYLVVRSSGNILVDSPRFAKPLVRRIEELGGIKTIFLTHQDDVADHRKFKDHFGATEIIHEDDVRRTTEDAELKIRGGDPLKLDDEVILIPVPGHTAGSACLLYQDKYLFTGDHLALDPDERHLYAFRNACWYDWEEQTRSMKKLLDYRFEWVLPGHSHRGHFSAEEMKKEIERCIRVMEGHGLS